MRVLVRQALRMRPDRLVVGEVRGDEVTDLLAAMNTGHEGGCGTLHDNSAADVPARVEALAMAAGMPQAAVHSQLAAAVDAVVHLARGPDGRRRVAEVAALRRTPGGVVVAEPAVTFDADGRTHEHPAAGALVDRLDGWPDRWPSSPSWRPRRRSPCCGRPATAPPGRPVGHRAGPRS